ncbi:hypothetical protein B0H10DRAFT_511831 [Mycena sp. CBHHK59/15]|nr:hypothetical protein B0H10DRAFT_511831 [Mycena sp. CBHHK59/15]
MTPWSHRPVGRRAWGRRRRARGGWRVGGGGLSRWVGLFSLRNTQHGRRCEIRFEADASLGPPRGESSVWAGDAVCFAVLLSRCRVVHAAGVLDARRRWAAARAGRRRAPAPVARGEADRGERLWKRAFWVLVYMDRQISSSLGRPSAIQYDECVFPPTYSNFPSASFVCQNL